MDIEMAFADADDVIKILVQTFKDMIKAVMKENQKELALLDAKLEVPKIKIVEYEAVIKKLKKKGFPIEFGHDFSRDHESSISEIYGEAVIIKRFPRALRAFYSMPCKENPELTESFDFIYRGLEILSGAAAYPRARDAHRVPEEKGPRPEGLRVLHKRLQVRCATPLGMEHRA